jgi:hypothetical protein
MGFAHAPGYESLFAFLEFGLQQRFEEAQVCSAFSYRLLGKFGALCADSRQMQHLTLLADGGYFERRSVRAHGATSGLSNPS